MIYQRDVIAKDSADIVVAIASAANEAILITYNRRDFAELASRFSVSQRRLRKLSKIDLRCAEPQAAARIRAGLSLIESEWLIAQEEGDGRIFIEVQGAAFRTIR